MLFFSIFIIHVNFTANPVAWLENVATFIRFWIVYKLVVEVAVTFPGDITQLLHTDFTGCKSLGWNLSQLPDWQSEQVKDYDCGHFYLGRKSPWQELSPFGQLYMLGFFRKASKWGGGADINPCFNLLMNSQGGLTRDWLITKAILWWQPDKPKQVMEVMIQVLEQTIELYGGLIKHNRAPTVILIRRNFLTVLNKKWGTQANKAEAL